MKLHTDTSAFVGDWQDRKHRFGNRHRRWQLHPTAKRTTGLWLSATDELVVSTAAIATATATTTTTTTTTITTPTTITTVVPIANFDTSSTFEPVVFEPILNVPALVTFVLITTVFSALIVRTNQVEDAVQTRKQRQEEVRALKAREVGEGTVSPDELRTTLERYEDAVRREELLRNIVPGVVRIVPPSSSDRREEEARAIAKQYLGRDFDIGVPKRESESESNNSESEGRAGGLPGAAIGVLVMVALSQVGLLAFFNFGADPMSGNGGALL